MAHSPKKFGTHCDLVWGKLKLQTNKKNKIILKIAVKIFALATLILGFAPTSFAQSSATATASATLLVPISIDKTDNMDFGKLAVSAIAGTAVLTPTNTITATAGVTTFTGINTSPASFTVKGEKGRTFSISFPTTPIILTGPGSVQLTVDNFTCDKGLTSVLLPEGGSLLLKVGGTLNVPAKATAGTYTNSADLKVTVNYN